MKRVADGFYKSEEIYTPSEGVNLTAVVDIIDGDELDTMVELKGRFCISGGNRKEFIKSLGKLIEDHRI
jgi:hypothetical protein